MGKRKYPTVPIEPVLLMCGCWKNYDRPIPLIGDGLYCRFHGETTRVNSVNYKIHCTDCTYRRYVGNAPVTGEVRATKHAITKHHLVRLIKYVDSDYDSEIEVGGKSKLHLDETLDLR
jgi:hypothetical protein